MSRKVQSSRRKQFLSETVQTAGFTRLGSEMTTRLQLILLAMVAPAMALDLIWINTGHFDIDPGAFVVLNVLGLALVGMGRYYHQIRHEERLAAMIYGAAFLVVMSNSYSLLNTLLLTIAGSRIDGALAAADRALGVDWPSMMVWASAHPLTNSILQLAYISMLPQIGALIVMLGLFGRSEQIYLLCIAVASGAAICIAAFTIAPSFGAFSVYSLPANVTRHLSLALDANYARELVNMLAHGPGHISVASLKGVIGFPSYHAVLALLVVWFARTIPIVRGVALILNLLVLIATPIQGGHDVVDVLAGVVVTGVAIWISQRAQNWARQAPLALGGPQTALS